MASSEKKIHLQLKSTEPHELQGDPFALEQVFRNLLENAIEASPDGSCIELTVSEHWLGASRGVEVRVRDFGVGLKPEAIERAFEPFFTTRVRGTGLGLPLPGAWLKAMEALWYSWLNNPAPVPSSPCR